MGKRLAQHEIPPEFHNRWAVAGVPGEDENAGRECKVLGYETDPQTGWDVVRVQFCDMPDLFADREAVMSPFMLFPVLPHGYRASAGCDERATC